MTTSISMLAIDLAKGSFQVCAVGPEGTVLYNRSLSRTRLATLLAEQRACIVAMEACATSHYWGRVAKRTARPPGSACPGGLCEAVCEASEERQGGRGSHRGGGLAPDDALRGGQERRDSGARGRFPDASMSGPATHAAHQRASRTSGRVRPCSAEGTCEPEVAGERARRRGHGPATPGSGDGNDLPWPNRAAHRGDRTAGG